MGWFQECADPLRFVGPETTTTLQTFHHRSGRAANVNTKAKYKDKFKDKARGKGRVRVRVRGS